MSGCRDTNSRYHGLGSTFSNTGSTAYDVPTTSSILLTNASRIRPLAPALCRRARSSMRFSKNALRIGSHFFRLRFVGEIRNDEGCLVLLLSIRLSRQRGFTFSSGCWELSQRFLPAAIQLPPASLTLPSLSAEDEDARCLPLKRILNDSNQFEFEIRPKGRGNCSDYSVLNCFNSQEPLPSDSSFRSKRRFRGVSRNGLPPYFGTLSPPGA